MDAIKTLEDILARTTKNTSNEIRKKAVEALQTLSAEDGGFKRVSEYLMKLHYSVCQAFFEKFCLSASDESVIAAAEALINDEKFNNGNPNNIMYPKGLSAALAMAAKDHHQASLVVLNRILSQADKSSGFAKGCINSFQKLIIEPNAMPFIMNIFEKISKGELACEKSEQNRFARFINTLNKNALAVSSDATAIASAKTKAAPASSAQSNFYPSETKAADAIDGDALAQFGIILQEILSAMHRMEKNQSTVDSLSAAITRRDEEVASLKTELSEKELNISAPSVEAATKERQLSEMRARIDNLTERLRISLQMDGISKSQELITLKKDMSEALKLDYADFIKSKGNICNEDLFEAYRSTLSRIFKILKRFGVDCQ